MSRKISIDDKIICERIKDLRSELKITGSEFANKIGISQGYLSDIENANSSPKKTLLLAISYIYNINYDWLLTGEGEMIREDKKGSLYNKVEDEDPEIVDLLSRTMEILKSGTDYSASLTANIRSFHRAIKTENRLNGVESRLASLEAERKMSEEIRKEDPTEKKEELIKRRVM